MTVASVRAVIADDEAPARRRIRKLLESRREFEIVAECGAGKATVDAVHRHRPDLLFLDVQMPELDGFGVLRALRPERLPAVIFVTAYDRYALDAFDAHAVDYLLKPFDDERFAAALEHALEHLDAREAQRLRDKLRDLLDHVEPEGAAEADDAAPPPGGAASRSTAHPSAGATRRFAVRKRDRIVLVEAEQIDWIAASGDYVTLHVGEASYLLRRRMHEIERQLDDSRFLRIHRSCIVHIDRIDHLSPFSHGDYTVTLRDGTELRMSRTYREAAAAALGLTL